MKCDELKRFDVVGKYRDEETMAEFRPDGECYDADEVDAAIAELKDENSRLKRALYKARANWADVVAFEETEGIGHDNSVAERWRKMESKCLKKAEEHK